MSIYRVEIKRPEWTGDVIKKLYLWGLSKQEFSRMIGYKSTTVSNVLTGIYNRPEIKAKILAKIAELEANQLLPSEQERPTVV